MMTPRTLGLGLAVVLWGARTVIATPVNNKADSAEKRLDAIAELRRTIHTLSYAEAARRVAALEPRAPKQPSAYPQSKIEHFVVLYHENHGFDQMLGCLADSTPGVDGIPLAGRVVEDASGETAGVNVTCGSSPYVCDSGPSYNLFAGKFANGTDSDCRAYPYDEQSDAYSFQNLGSAPVTVQMYAPEQVPVKTALARNFGLFNRLYTAVPTNSMPNHMFTQTGTSCGAKDNIWPWTDCGGASKLYPQWTLYDQLRVDGVSFKLYFTLDQNDDLTEPPDAYMAGVARALPHWRTMESFYDDARTGALPAFSWVIPNAHSTDHPCNDNRNGEAIQKAVYEALRASPAWNATALFIGYDDAGGYYDHVVPPFEGVPADGAACSAGITRCADPFDFRRLGLRSTALFASPWVPAGTVAQEPTAGTYATSQFDLASVIATTRDLFGLSSNLTARDDWSASFAELLTEDEPRTDAPLTLPDAPTDEDDGEFPSNDPTRPVAKHCSALDGVCRGPEALTNKQRRNLPLYAYLAGEPAPDQATMSKTDASEWLGRRLRDLMDRGLPKVFEDAGDDDAPPLTTTTSSSTA